jgi:peroxiredoxin 2/4
MKKITSFTVVFCLLTTLTWSQNHMSIPLIGDKAPSFTAESTNGRITFPDDYGKNWKILFSHPKDFTPVCSSELLELSQMQSDFDKLGVKLAVISTDNLENHNQWKASLETITYKGDAPQKISFPLVADDKLSISKSYGMLHTPSSTTKDVRGVFIIDPNNVVQAIYFYPMNVGRNMEEIKRTVIALQTAQENVLIPANWQPGDDVILSYLNDEEKASIGKPNSGIYEVAWYMIFKKMKT